MRTKYCPHCASQKIHRVDEDDGSHYHECEDCQETWKHCDSADDREHLIGSHDF